MQMVHERLHLLERVKFFFVHCIFFHLLHFFFCDFFVYIHAGNLVLVVGERLHLLTHPCLPYHARRVLHNMYICTYVYSGLGFIKVCIYVYTIHLCTDVYVHM
jgi:hypothetical protein